MNILDAKVGDGARFCEHHMVTIRGKSLDLFGVEGVIKKIDTSIGFAYWEPIDSNHRSVPVGTWAVSFEQLEPCPLMRVNLVIEKAEKKETRYPHKCPKCGNPAYIGFSTIECVLCGDPNLGGSN
jgi:hypothetical protein